MSEEPAIPPLEEPVNIKPKSRARVLVPGRISIEHAGKFIQCAGESRLRITNTGSVVNPDKNRAFERALRARVGKKKARKLLKTQASAA